MARVPDRPAPQHLPAVLGAGRNGQPRPPASTPSPAPNSFATSSRCTSGAPAPLGTHENKPLPTGSEPGEPRLVLVIRGDLLKRYPTAIIYAQKAKWVDDPNDPFPPRRKIRVLDQSTRSQVLEPTFKAEVLPDIRFLGFDLTVPEAKGSSSPQTTTRAGSSSSRSALVSRDSASTFRTPPRPPLEVDRPGVESPRRPR